MKNRTKNIIDIKGIFPKYNVSRIDGKPVSDVLVIELNKDPQRVELMLALADVWQDSRPNLANDLILRANAEQMTIDGKAAGAK